MVQDARPGSEAPHKGRADVGSQVTGTLRRATCQRPDTDPSQLSISSLGVSHSCTLRSSRSPLCQRDGVPPRVSNVTLVRPG